MKTDAAGQLCEAMKTPARVWTQGGPSPDVAERLEIIADQHWVLGVVATFKGGKIVFYPWEKITAISHEGAL